MVAGASNDGRDPPSSCAWWPATSNGICTSAWRRSCSRTTIPELVERERSSPVQVAQVSGSAWQEAASRSTPDGLLLHSMHTQLADLGSLTPGYLALAGIPDHEVIAPPEPTPLQQRTFQLLNLDPANRLPHRVQMTIEVSAGNRWHSGNSRKEAEDPGRENRHQARPIQTNLLPPRRSENLQGGRRSPRDWPHRRRAVLLSLRQACVTIRPRKRITTT